MNLFMISYLILGDNQFIKEMLWYKNAKLYNIYTFLMKIIEIILQILLTLVFIIFITFWFSAYNSAFEADRACHSLLSNYSNSTNLGCDHDTETHKWILYENQENGVSAKVIKRFRYRFL